MKTIHLLKPLLLRPRWDTSDGSPPSIKEQQASTEKKKKKKKFSTGHEGEEREDGGPGSGPQAGQGSPGFGQSPTGKERRKAKNVKEREKRSETLRAAQREKNAQRQRAAKDLKRAGL